MLDPRGRAHVKNFKSSLLSRAETTQKSNHMTFKNEAKIDFVSADPDSVNISSLAYQLIVSNLGGSNSAGEWSKTVVITVMLPRGRNVNSTYLLLLHVEQK